MHEREKSKFKKLLGWVLALSLLLSGMYVTPVAAQGPEATIQTDGTDTQSADADTEARMASAGDTEMDTQDVEESATDKDAQTQEVDAALESGTIGDTAALGEADVQGTEAVPTDEAETTPVDDAEVASEDGTDTDAVAQGEADVQDAQTDVAPSAKSQDSTNGNNGDDADTDEAESAPSDEADDVQTASADDAQAGDAGTEADTEADTQGADAAPAGEAETQDTAEAENEAAGGTVAQSEADAQDAETDVAPSDDADTALADDAEAASEDGTDTGAMTQGEADAQGTDAAPADEAESAPSDEADDVQTASSDDAQAVAETGTVTHTFDATTLPQASVDNEEIPAGTTYDNGYFKTVGILKKRVVKDGEDMSVKSVEVAKKGGSSLQFTVTGTADVTMEMSSTGSSNTSAVGLQNEAGKLVANTDGKDVIEVSQTKKQEITYTGLPAGTYQVLSPDDQNSDHNTRGARLYTVTVNETAGGERPARADWAGVAAPVIDKVELDASDSGKVNVTVTAFIGYDGADSLKVTMSDSTGAEVDTQSVADESPDGVADAHTLAFEPTATGTYTFTAALVRDGEEDKASAEAKNIAFTLPLAKPVMISVTSSGNGTATVKWNEVPEAEGYTVTATKAGDSAVAATAEATGTEAVLEGLVTGERYSVSVTAKRGDEVSEASDPIEVLITQEAQREWAFSAYGASTNTKNNGYEGNINEGSVTVYSEGGKGKIQPESHDGLAFYYTTVDPQDENFTLTADIHLDSWTYSNAQEGFGIMAADAVGVSGNSASFYNNSVQAVASKIEYYYDGSAVTSDTSAQKITMKLGLGYIIKSGLTAQDVADINAGTKQLTEVATVSNESGTLETSAGPRGAGTYNLFGNYDASKGSGGTDIEPLLTDIRLQLQRDNTGYTIRYLDMGGNVLGEKVFYDQERNALTKIDPDHIYVGFFAARNARITVSNMTFSTVSPQEDDAAKEHEIEYVYPNYAIESATVSNSSDYDLVFYGNADGILTIVDADGNVVVDGQHVLANTKNAYPVVLKEGENVFTVTFAPDADYRPGEYQMLNSYEAKTFEHTVRYDSYDVGNCIYVAPDGTGDGSVESPTNIYEAVQYAKPGQRILLSGGTYQLGRTVTVERGIDGTSDNLIYLVARSSDPSERPVLDFGGACAGMVLAGDYWHLEGFDVTNSANGEKGLQVSGDNNRLVEIHAYKNGNTGIQISRFKGTDEYADWPSNNLILNCTSYLNADSGYEDADGFAAKLTVGDGNVFDGCVSAYNADDGWDLFAKVQTGSIGAVTIKNCVAFRNGYVLKAGGEGGALDLNGALVDAGNGNGFKMGGDSLSGYHTLRNSIAFANKAKGIDSNSCPDIQVISSTSFDNGSHNVAFYTNNAPNTDFLGDGILSMKVTNTVGENLKPVGSQNEGRIYGDKNYYYDGTKSANANGSEATLDWFERTDVENAMFLLTEDGRNADGSIDMQGLLQPTDVVPEGVGARLDGNGTPSQKLSRTRSSAETGIPIGSVPSGILGKLGCKDEEALESYLAQDARAKASEKLGNGYTVAGTKVYEVKIEVHVNGEWVEATAENFPPEGADVTIPYPDGTNGDFDFVVSHLVVLGCNGQNPGDIEYFSTNDNGEARARRTDSGLVVHVKSASPFTVAWAKKDKETATPTNPAPANPQVPTGPTALTAPTNPATPAAPTSPKTSVLDAGMSGSDALATLAGLFAALSLCGIVVLEILENKNKKRLGSEK